MGVNYHGGCLLPNDSYQKWLTFNCKGSSVIFKAPRVQWRNLKIMMCIVDSSTTNNMGPNDLKNMLVKITQKLPFNSIRGRH